MKSLLVFGLVSVGFQAMAVEQLQCEVITITNSVGGITEANYHPSLIKVDMDKGGEGEAMIDPKSETVLRVTEDQYLKGLFQVLLTRGSSPMGQPDGAVLSALLKKDQMVTNEDLGDLLISTISLKSGQKARAYGVLNSGNLTSVATVSLTNKFLTELRDANKTLVGNDRIFFQNPMIIQSAISLVSQPKVQKILAAKFSEGEVIMTGLNILCIETPK